MCLAALCVSGYEHNLLSQAAVDRAVYCLYELHNTLPHVGHRIFLLLDIQFSLKHYKNIICGLVQIYFTTCNRLL